MLFKHRLYLLSLTVVFLLLLNAVSPISVLADGESPPVTSEETDEVAEAPETEETTTESIDETSIEAEMPPDIVDENNETSLTLPAIMEQAPEGTTLAVINQDGGIEPLATEQAAEILAVGDPMWCPATVNPGDAGCTPGYNNFADLLAELKTGTYSGDGIIWVEIATFNEEVEIDGASSTGAGGTGLALNSLLGSLTVQGGWNGFTGIDAGVTGVSNFARNFSITNWTSNIFINNIVIDFDNNTYASNPALEVKTSGNIELNDVSVSNNTSGAGALLDTCGWNQAGSNTKQCASPGNVTVNQSNFTNNINGLLVDSGGTITLNNTNATLNNYFGAGLLNYDLLGTGGVSVTNSTFSNNFQSNDYTGDDAAGLYANSDGNVMLTEVNAGNNINGAGAYLVSDGDVTINVNDTANFNIFNGNADSGIWVDALGNIFLLNVESSNNGFDGADLVNYNGNGRVGITNSTFSGNDDTGLYAISKGTISLVDVLANNNNSGAYLINNGGAGNVSVASSAPGTINNNFNNNSWTGLHIASTGQVTLADLTASGNNTNGAYVVTQGDVTVTHSGFDNNVQFNYPQDPGLYVKTPGNITLLDVTAQGNKYGAGAVLNSNSNNAISVSGISTFNENGTYGLQANNNTGNITLTDVVANKNGEKGAYLTTGGDGKIVVQSTDPNAITSAFNTNESYGIYAHSVDGNIELYAIEASFNGNKGVYLVASCTCLGNIFINNGLFVENGNYGIYALTNEGNIRLQIITVTGDNGVANTANDNLTNIGAFLRTDNGGNVWIEDSTFELNTETGLVIVSSGQVDLINVTADQNGGNGVEIYSPYTYDCLCPGDVPASIVVNVDGGRFTHNGEYGIYALPGPAGALNFVDPPSTTATFFENNGLGDFLVDLLFVPQNCPPCSCGECCDPKQPKQPKNPKVVDIPEDGFVDPVPQDCETTSGTILQFFNGSHVNIGCPFEGESNASLLKRENLPGRLPTGFTFVSGIEVVLTSSGQMLTSMDANGNIIITFQIPEDMLGKMFSVLFWNPAANNGEGAWVEMPLFEAGTSFPLNPDDGTDGRTIISGVKQAGNTITLTVNFPGAFVLVAR